jgi:allantoin racemase
MTAEPIRIWHQSFTVLEDLMFYAGTLQRHVRRAARAGTTVDLHGMQPGTYPSSYPGDHIRFSYLQRRHTQQFIDAARVAQAQEYDAYFISTVPDVGYEDIRTLVDIPVIAYGQASLLIAATLGARVGIVNFIEALQPQLRRNARDYGLDGLLGPVVTINANFSQIADAYERPQPLIAAFRQAARSAIADGATVIVPGEGPLNVFLADHGIGRVDDIPVIDSIAASVKLCELRVDLYRASGLLPSRAGLYYERPADELIDAVEAFYREDPSAP